MYSTPGISYAIPRLCLQLFDAELVLIILQIVFRATVGSSFTGDIAIDDITFNTGCCSSKFCIDNTKLVFQ